MEGAFNAGILAARAVSHYPFEIDGLGYEVTRDPLHPHVELPRDDALLDGPLLQWWYWTGQLQSDKGRRFGFEEVFFDGQALGQIVDGVMAQAAVSDVEANRFEWMRFEKDSPVHELIRTVPHVAFEVEGGGEACSLGIGDHHSGLADQHLRGEVVGVAAEAQMLLDRLGLRLPERLRVPSHLHEM